MLQSCRRTLLRQKSAIIECFLRLLLAAVWWHHTHVGGEDRIHWVVSARLPPPYIQGPVISQPVSVQKSLSSVECEYVWMTVGVLFVFFPMQTKRKTEFHWSRCGKPTGWRDGSCSGLVMCDFLLRAIINITSALLWRNLEVRVHERRGARGVWSLHNSWSAWLCAFLKWFSASGSCLHTIIQAWKGRGKAALQMSQLIGRAWEEECNTGWRFLGVKDLKSRLITQKKKWPILV